MNIFFGKISQKFDTKQINGGYYISPKGSSWFGELQIGDYVYLIGSAKIQFWKASKWGTIDGVECLYFEILNKDLNINTAQLMALKFLKLTKALIVLTTRSARMKAFFRLELLQDVELSQLSDSNFYKNQDLYRTIKVVEPHSTIKQSEDIQLIYENGQLSLIPNTFIEDSIMHQFVDNLRYRGKGAKMKDKVLNYFSNALSDLPISINLKQISIRPFYDTFFCEYTGNLKYYLLGAFWKGSDPEDQTEIFLKESLWKNGFETELMKEVNAIPVGSNVAIKSSYVRARKDSVMMIKARGIVQENLQDGHTLIVEWFDDFVPFEVPIGSYRKDTVKEVTNKVHIQTIWQDDDQDLISSNINNSNNKAMVKELSLNQILFGPPGTGKTYNTINKAISIVNPSFDLNEERSVVKEEFDRLTNEGRIAFTTFHQNMSYEDFIEGIKPLKPEEEDTFIKYDIEAGIFKIACANAAYLCYKKYKQSIEKKSAYSFDELHDAFIDHIQTLMDKGKPPIYKTLKGKDVTVIKITSTNSIKARALNSKATRNPAPLTKENLQKLYDKFSSIDEIRNLKQVEDAVEVTPRITEFYALFRALKEFEKDVFKPDTDYEDEIGEVETIDIQDKIKKFNAGVYLEAIKKYGIEADPVVLIIDEINRGNVSQIFGELITLIENDKRLGKEESLEVYLPYSKSKFGVPPNLYIIGTMNTADRSVEALDTALRRRFSFEEMPPLPSLLSPNHRFWELLWKYKEVKWDDPKYSLKEKKLLDFMGASQKIWDEKERLWNDFEKEGKSSMQISRFSNDEFMGVNLEKLLSKINSRIEKLLNKDHCIGHSYFINITSYDDLKMTFHNKIIPLLQEYFFGDYGKIGLILGKDFFETVNEEMDNTNIFCDFYDYDGSNFESQTQFRLKNISKLSDDDFKVAIATLIK